MASSSSSSSTLLPLPLSPFPSHQFTVAVIGAGFSGISAAYYLRKQFGNTVNIVILEKGTGVAGTWHWNTYPGAACDIPSHFYSLSFALNPEWPRHYSRQRDIRAYLQKVCDTFDITRLVQFQSTVESVVWKENFGVEEAGSTTHTHTHDDSRFPHWKLTYTTSAAAAASSSSNTTTTTTTTHSLCAKYVFTGFAPLSEPTFPKIPGILNNNNTATITTPPTPPTTTKQPSVFQGPSFHSARWDHTITLSQKRIAVIGTGASVAQFLPEIAPHASQVTVYQRTPAWVAPRWDFPFPRILKWLFRYIPGILRLFRYLLFVYHDVRYFGFIRPISLISWLNKVFLSWHMKRVIKNPSLREALTPSYPLGCKRVILSDDYYPALARENVKVVVGGVRAITEGGVVGGDGVERAADVIIYGTGFDIEGSMTNLHIVGRRRKRSGSTTSSTSNGSGSGSGHSDNNLEAGDDNSTSTTTSSSSSSSSVYSLTSAWSIENGGVRAYKGITVPGFPNLFLTLGPNTGLGHSSVVSMIEAQIVYSVQGIAKAENEGWKYFEAREDSAQEHDAKMQKGLEGAVWQNCLSWYNGFGNKNSTMWPYTVTRYHLDTYVRGVVWEDYHVLK